MVFTGVAESLENILERIFILTYYGKFNYSEVLNLEKNESNWFIQRIIEQVKKENKS